MDSAAYASNSTPNPTPDALSWSDFGSFLQRLRRRRGLSQLKLAERLDCDRTYVWRLEHGHNRPSRMFLQLLGALCELTPEELNLVTAFKRLRGYIGEPHSKAQRE